jgi:hypothetical protein
VAANKTLTVTPNMAVARKQMVSFIKRLANAVTPNARGEVVILSPSDVGYVAGRLRSLAKVVFPKRLTAGARGCASTSAAHRS